MFMADIRNVPPQQVVKFTLTVTDLGKINVKVFDRIIVDDVTVHLINKEIYRLLTSKDPGADVDRSFKDFLVKERYQAR
jgi:hypothetical protein